MSAVRRTIFTLCCLLAVSSAVAQQWARRQYSPASDEVGVNGIYLGMNGRQVDWRMGAPRGPYAQYGKERPGIRYLSSSPEISFDNDSCSQVSYIHGDRLFLGERNIVTKGDSSKKLLENLGPWKVEEVGEMDCEDGIIGEPCRVNWTRTIVAYPQYRLLVTLRSAPKSDASECKVLDFKLGTDPKDGTR